MTGVPVIAKLSIKKVSPDVLAFKVKRTRVIVPVKEIDPEGNIFAVPSTSVPLEFWDHTVCQLLVTVLNTSTVPDSERLVEIRSRSQSKERVALVSGVERVRVICAIGFPPFSSTMAPAFAKPAVVQSPLQPVPPDHVTELKSSKEELTVTGTKVAVRRVSLVEKRNG